MLKLVLASKLKSMANRKKKKKNAGTGTKATIILKVAGSKDILRSDTCEKLKKISWLVYGLMAFDLEIKQKINQIVKIEDSVHFGEFTTKLN